MSVPCAIYLGDEAVATDTRQREAHDFALMIHTNTHWFSITLPTLLSVDSEDELSLPCTRALRKT